LPTYKVYGSKTQEFYTDIPAADPDEAYDIAYKDPVQWFEIEINDPIEPHTVELLDIQLNKDNIQLNKDNVDDDYPTMENGIIVGGTN
jgi:hypothetical protein